VPVRRSRILHKGVRREHHIVTCSVVVCELYLGSVSGTAATVSTATIVTAATVTTATVAAATTTTSPTTAHLLPPGLPCRRRRVRVLTIAVATTAAAATDTDVIGITASVIFAARPKPLLLWRRGPRLDRVLV
jgi:hypothetical protein